MGKEGLCLRVPRQEFRHPGSVWKGFLPAVGLGVEPGEGLGELRVARLQLGGGQDGGGRLVAFLQLPEGDPEVVVDSWVVGDVAGGSGEVVGGLAKTGAILGQEEAEGVVTLAPIGLEADDFSEQFLGFAVAASATEEGGEVHAGGNEGGLALDGLSIVAFGLGGPASVLGQDAKGEAGLGSVEVVPVAGLQLAKGAIEVCSHFYGKGLET